MGVVDSEEVFTAWGQPSWLPGEPEGIETAAHHGRFPAEGVEGFHITAEPAWSDLGVVVREDENEAAGVMDSEIARPTEARLVQVDIHNPRVVLEPASKLCLKGPLAVLVDG
jgi:hypothetical protein